MTCSRAKIAVFFDADNISLASAAAILQYLEKTWDPFLKRAYGSNIAQHQAVLRQHGIIPVEVIRNTPGKNAADMALIIDAMQELCLGAGQAFCIVSSDADFTRLAQRMREFGKTVIVCGTKQTPQALRGACTQFLLLQWPASEKKEQPPRPIPPLESNDPEADSRLWAELRLAFGEFAAETGSSEMSRFGDYLREKRPEIWQMRRGFGKFGNFLKKRGGFELKERHSKDGVVTSHELLLRAPEAGLESTEPASDSQAPSPSPILDEATKPPVFAVVPSAPSAAEEIFQA